MAKKAKNGIKLRTERSVQIKKVDDKMLLTRRQTARRHMFVLGQAALCQLWQKSSPWLRSIGF